MLKIGWVGFHIEGLYAFENLLNKGIIFQAFLTLNNDSMVNRSAGTRKYKSLCEKYYIPYFEIENINDENVYELLKNLSLDLLIVIGWSQILSSKIISIPKIGTIGAHASLLPYNRGSAPVNWAIIRGETLSGNTLMWLDEGIDTGKIIEQVPIPISKYDTCKTIYEEVTKTNYIMIDKLLDSLINKIDCELINKYDSEEVLPRRRPSDGLIDWTQDSNDIYDFIRALTMPYPGAFSFLNGNKWVIWKCAMLPESKPMDPGIVISSVVSTVENACGIMVACGKGAIILLEIEDEAGETFKGRDLAEINWKGKKMTNE